MTKTAETEVEAAPPLESATPRPPSVVPILDGLVGLVSVTVCWAAVMAFRPPLLIASWVLLLSAMVPLLLRELLRSAPRPPERMAISPFAWLIGFVLATAPFLLVHGKDSGLELWVFAWLIVAPAFLFRFIAEWLRNRTISGGFPSTLGRAIFPGRWREAGRLAAPARLWALKAFFIPLYAMSLITLIKLAYASELTTLAGWFGLLVAFAYTIDVSFGLSGYLTASNSLVDTVRSTQTRLIGWLACIACYSPIIAHFPTFERVLTDEIIWPGMMTASPVVVAGAIAMLLLMALFVWGTVSFGPRFCNLADRGLISSGPFRWMKHPAYFAHAANAWIITFIFLPAAGITLGPLEMLVPVGLSVIYWLRARTEEQHLSVSNPDYRAYSAWIARHGLLAQLRRLLSIA